MLELTHILTLGKMIPETKGLMKKQLSNLYQKVRTYILNMLLEAQLLST